MDSLMSNKEGVGSSFIFTASPHQSSNSIGRLWNKISSVTSFISSYRLQPHLSLHLSVNHSIFTRGRWKMTGRGSPWCQQSWGFSVLLQGNCLGSQEQRLLLCSCGITSPKLTPRSAPTPDPSTAYPQHKQQQFHRLLMPCEG